MRRMLLCAMVLFSGCASVPPADMNQCPFLTSDPTGYAVECEVIFNDNPDMQYTAGPREGDTAVWIDLENIITVPGTYNVKGRCQNVDGWWSAWSEPFQFIRPETPTPDSIKLTK